MQAVEPKIDRGVYRVLTVEASVNARKSLGGTAPANVVRAVAEARRRFLGRQEGGAMSFFAYKNGEMHAEGVALATIAAQVGTPFYCYSAGALRAAWKEFADGIKGMNAEVCYAMKANSQPGGGPPVRRAGGGVRHRLGGRDAPRAGGRRARPSASSIPASARRPRS